MTNHYTDNCFYLYPDKRPDWWHDNSNRPNKPNKPNLAKQQEQKNMAIINAILSEPENDTPKISDESKTSDETKRSDETDQTMSFSDEFLTNQDLDMDIDNLLLDIDDTEEVSAKISPKSRKMLTNTGYLNIIGNKKLTYQIGPICNFVIDTAATISVITNINYFFYKKAVSETVNWGKALRIPIRYKGSIAIRTNQNFIYIMHNVLYMPELGINILSTNKLKGVSIFKENSVSIYKDNILTIKGYKDNLYRTNTTILYIKNNNDISNYYTNTIYYKKKLYPSTKGSPYNLGHGHHTLEGSSPHHPGGKPRTYRGDTSGGSGAYISGSIPQDYRDSSPCNSGVSPHNKDRMNKKLLYTTQSPDQDIINWHKKLGHIGPKALYYILKNIDNNICIDNIYKLLHNCEICLKSKAKRQINKISKSPTIYKKGERIHSDIGGPINPKTYNNYAYYITFLDKLSRYLFVILLKNKNQAILAFKKIRNLLKTQINIDIKEIFTDNGKEYINKQFNNITNKYGIIHSKSPIYTKEPNGFIERINLTLMNKVRAILANSKAPNYLWGEALLAATYLYNRTPHSALGFRTPYELYYNIKPDTSIYNNLYTWGSTAYYTINKQITKLEPRQEKAILVGFTDYGFYKLYLPEKRTTIISRDVTIIDNQFFDIKDRQEETIWVTPKTLKPKPSNLNPKPYGIKTRAAAASEIAQDPRHKIEVQIPIRTNSIDYISNDITKHINNNNILYTISDTGIENLYRPLTKSLLPFILTITNNKEPNTLKQALQSPDCLLWKKACIEENRALVSQKTWDIVDIPNDIKPIPGRWIFKMKPTINRMTNNTSHITNSDNTIRYKARWVIQGFNQKLGIDFLETFSTTCRTETWHMLLIIAVNKGLYVWQYDVKNAFCHANIDTNIYTILPIGLYTDTKYQNKCAKLNKALYGLKQAPRLWNQYLKTVLKTMGFRVFVYDEGIFINEEMRCILICHVDDILVLHHDLTYIKNLRISISKYIELDEIGQVTTFLGNDIYIDYKSKRLYISQSKYIDKILSKFDIYDNNNYKPKQTPGESGIKLCKNPTTASNTDIKQYQQETGSILYLALKTRPDIAFAISNCSRYMSNPSKDHFKAIAYIWCYLLLYKNLGLIYNCFGNNLYIKGYCDSDWANDINNRRSTTGYIFSLSGDLGLTNPISWNSQLQKSVALSSCEAEYMALKEATKEAIYLNNIFQYINNILQLGYNNDIPLILLDNESAAKLAENPEFHKRSKHIDIIYHYTREAIQNNLIKIVPIPSKDNIADIFTKNTTKEIFNNLKSKVVSYIDKNIV
jgi:hypothetical protein